MMIGSLMASFTSIPLCFILINGVLIGVILKESILICENLIGEDFYYTFIIHKDFICLVARKDGDDYQYILIGKCYTLSIHETKDYWFMPHDLKIQGDKYTCLPYVFLSQLESPVIESPFIILLILKKCLMGCTWLSLLVESHFFHELLEITLDD